jgi:glycosyltransferase involved in cell wall biosynthesis
MRDRGHRVTLAVQPGSELAARGAAAGLEVAAVRLGGWLDPRSLVGLAAVMRRARCEVVCANLDKEIRQARLAALLAGRRVRLVARRGSPDPIKDTWHYRLVYLRGVDRLICNAEALVAKVCGPAPWYPRERVRVIPNGVDVTDLDSLATPDAVAAVRGQLGVEDGTDGLVISCVGEVGWRKGQEHVLAAAAALRESFPRTIWVIAGEGSGRVELEAAAAEMGLVAAGGEAGSAAGGADGGVHFLGFRRDVPAILAASDVVVLPTRREGFPNTLLEAMALGRPIAASTADGIPELITDGETGLLHDVDDVAAFTRQVAALLADPSLRTRLGAAARSRATRDFAADAVMDRVEDCLCRW